ncbi:MAG: hypothetical protein WAR57_08055, partial [Candidatus Phosphoribacter sp.]
MRVFLSDPGGGVYSIVGKPPTVANAFGEWGGWSPVSEGASTPGGAISAVRKDNGRVHAFIADPGGGVYTIVELPDGSWSGWESVAHGSTVPGGVVSAVLSPTGRIRLFVADPLGGIFTASRRDEPNWGQWSPVPGVTTLPGAPIGVVPDEGDTVRLVVADHTGAVRTTAGSASQGWRPWEAVSEGSTMPGAPVTTVRHPSGRVSVVLADRGFGVYAATTPRSAAPWTRWTNVSDGRVGGRPRSIVLRDPDGAAQASSDTGSLSLDLGLPLLDRSRTADGTPRLWSLEVAPSQVRGGGPPTPVSAIVVATTRLDLAPINDRIDALLGPDGEKVSFTAETTAGRARLRMTILDRVTAATLDFHGQLDSLLESVEQDPGVGTDIQEHTAYTVVDASASLGYGLELDLDGLRVTRLRFEIGAAEHLAGPLPAAKLSVGVEGEVLARISGFPLATARLREESVALEIGLSLGPNGEFASHSWVSGDGSLVDVDIHWQAAIAAGVVSPLGSLSAAIAAELVESALNGLVEQFVARLALGGPTQVRHAFARFLGADFTYLSLGMEGNELVLAYLAPMEPQPTPSPIFRPVIGRDVEQDVDGRWQVAPDERGDTWANSNLTGKIDHIVMVMMENRSYDHVLGYLAGEPVPAGDGLNAEILGYLTGLGTPSGRLADSAITPNGVGLRTRFPAPVGHSLAAVTEQLSLRGTLPSGREVNSPAGFL